MSTGRYYLVLAIVTAILCAPVFSEVEALRPHEPVLLGKADQTLAGIDKLYVVITQVDAEPNEDGLNREELEARIINKLEDCGIKITAAIAGDILNIPELRVSTDMLKLKDLQQYVFRIQTSLATKVSLPGELPLCIKADVWKTEPAMQAVSIKDMPAAVTGVVLEQVDAFIHAYLAANQPGTGVSDANVASVTAATKRVGRRPAEYKFVASRNSNVFHRPDCSSAERIKPANLVGYNSRGEALKAGKRPCKRCKP
jgi:hypothetical protein